MATEIVRRHAEACNPLDVVEGILVAHEWNYERVGDREISVSVDGPWCRYYLWFARLDTPPSVQFSCAFDIVVPRRRLVDVQSLLALANARLWLGHFAMWDEDGAIAFQHTHVLSDTSASAAQMEDIVSAGFVECERFYPAFQFVLWGGKTPIEAIAAALLETVGSA
ncbi:MAG: hypothetical protein FJX56_09095 [Alphaproteobacteria bacterium]|nr:hypothetical protein [Alphaproteobacteria bacterium]